MCSYENMLALGCIACCCLCSSDILRHQDKRGASSKRVKPTAQKNPAPQSQMLFAEPSPIVHAPQPDEGQQLKSIRNKLDYERRKGSQMVRR
jgi:hypothetical protein